MNLISDSMREEYQRLNRGELGNHGAKWAPAVMQHIDREKPRTILDYGCGPGSLGKTLREYGYTVTEYDPGVPGKSELPKPHDFVCNIAVLEHVELDQLQDVLRHISDLTLGCAFITVGLGPSKHTLTDGRNAHVIQKPPEWWKSMLELHFNGVEQLPWRKARKKTITNEAAFLCT